MSYILDAVRKADQERQENLAPTVHSLSVQSPPGMPVKSRMGMQWPVIVLGVLAVNVSGWYWLSQSEQTRDIVSLANDTQTRQISDVAPSERFNPAQNLQAGQQVAQLTTQDKRVHLWQAPVDAQNVVRALEFSFHVYADDASKRTIIINGQRVAEKEAISQDLRLEEITSSGVILRYQENLLIEVEILEQW